MPPLTSELRGASLARRTIARLIACWFERDGGRVLSRLAVGSLILAIEVTSPATIYGRLIL